MTRAASYAAAVNALETATAVVIPVYFPADADVAFATDLVGETAGACRRELGDGGAVCLSVDGSGPGAEAARAVAGDVGAQVVVSQENRGKLHAARQGVNRVLEDERRRYVVIVDQDGDHFANELLNFIRAARHVEAAVATERVLVLGRRISRHRPMGFLRGELEELADRLLLDALHYHSVVSGRPLRLQFATTLEEYPDFHSGYKLFTRATAADVFAPEPRPAGMEESAYSRHGVEAVMTVESLLAGAYLAVINRSTLDEQPVSTFGLFNRARMTADKILWPCKRLGVPGEFVAQWLRNHLPRLLLGTLLPQGRDELRAVWKLVLDGYEMPAEVIEATDAIERPRFI